MKKVKRKARHQYVYIVLFFDDVDGFAGASFNAFLSREDAVQYGKAWIDDGTYTFEVKKLPLKSEFKKSRKQPK